MLVLRSLVKVSGFCTSAMASKTLQPLSSEKPFGGDNFTNESVKRVYKANKNEILKMVTLMNSNVMYKDYGLINHICSRLLSFQKALSKDEIVRVLELCYRAQVANVALISHLENELLHRFNDPTTKLIEDHYLVKKTQAKQLFKALERQSGDIFQILNDPQAAKIQESEETEQSQVELVQLTQQVAPLSPQKLLEIDNSLQQFGNLGYLFTELQVRSTNLLQLFQEFYIVMGTSKNVNMKSLIQFTRINNHTCMKTQEEYERHKQYYLRRSLKKVKKHQTRFYQKTLPIVRDHLRTMSVEDFQSFLKEVAQYPAKTNRPNTYILQMFKEFTSLPQYRHDVGTLVALSKMFNRKPKLLQKLRIFNSGLGGVSQEVLNEIESNPN